MPFTVDYPKRRLVLHDRAAFRPPPVAPHRLIIRPLAARSVFTDANPFQGQPMVAGTIDGFRTPILLDTGFDGSLVLMPRFAKARPRFSAPGGRVVARASGAEGAMAGRELARAEVDYADALGARFRCGGTALLLLLGRDEEDRTYGAILGGQFLGLGRLTFAYAAGRVWAEW